MQVNDAFILRSLYGKYILMSTRSNNASGEPILLNDVAASIWKAASNRLERYAVLNDVSNSYGLQQGSPEIAAVEDFITHMENMGLLIKSCEGE